MAPSSSHPTDTPAAGLGTAPAGDAGAASIGRDALLRFGAAPLLAARDAAGARLRPYLPPRWGLRTGALDAAIDWLCLSHDATGRQGSSKAFSLLHGWMPGYPETTGYVIGTLLEYARRRGGRPDLVQRALEMGRWEVAVQMPDGGVMTGDVSTLPRRSVVFNTGMVLHGYVDLMQAGHDEFGEAGERAAAFLVDRMAPDGTWDPDAEFSNMPHVYNSRVAWAMLRWAELVGVDDVQEAAVRHLDWVLSMQRPNGWFEQCYFRPGMTPSTHAIAYTLRGLLESWELVRDDRYLDAVVPPTEALMRKLEVLGWLPASYEADWSPAASYACLTGTAQLGGVWLRLAQITGDDRYLNAGLKAVDLAAARQERGPWRPIRGALAGSWPVWGRYAPLQYPNWATKFLADSLMLRDDCVGWAA